MAVVAQDTIATEGNNIMARRDKRGPEGKGPMTGRGLGYCAGSDELQTGVNLCNHGTDDHEPNCGN